MAFFHLEAKVITRSTGRSSVGASAYASCSSLYNDYDGIQHDYTNKQGCDYSEIFLSKEAKPEWKDREELWNAVEATEKTKDSRLARELILALPREFSKEEQINVVKQYVQEQFVQDGMCADVNIHNSKGLNPHIHILLTVRPLNEDGTWQYKTEKEYLCKKDGVESGFTAKEFKDAEKDGWEKQYRFQIGKKKEYMTTTEAEKAGYERTSKYPKSSRFGRQNPIAERWNSDEQLVSWREAWADIVNKKMEQLGCEERIDHRSNIDRGVMEKPTIHEGYQARKMERMGFSSWAVTLNKQIRRDNQVMRELKETFERLTEKLKQTIPMIASALEKIREYLTLLHYELFLRNQSINCINFDLHQIEPLVEEYELTSQIIKRKQTERKQLQTQKNKLGFLDVVKQFELSNKISKLNDEIEDYKSGKKMLLKQMKCLDEKGYKKVKADIKKHKDNKALLLNRKSEIIQLKKSKFNEYENILAGIEPEKWQDLSSEIWIHRSQTNIDIKENAKATFKKHYNERSFSQLEKEIDDQLIQKQQKYKQRIAQRLEELRNKKPSQERQKAKPKKKRSQDIEL